MARIRTIKPEFWTDESITECSLSARLLFIGMWNFADDHGGIDGSPKQLKMKIFPADSIKIEPLVDELIAQGLLIEYSVNNKNYLHIKGFTSHQLINRPSKPVCPLYEDSLNTHGVLSAHSLPEGKGKERKGKELERIKSSTTPLNELATEQKAKMMVNDFALCFSDAFGSPFPRGCSNTAHQLCSEFDSYRIREAFEIASKHGIMTVAYVEGILRGNGSKRRKAGGVSETEWILGQNAQSCRDFGGGQA